MALMQRYLRSQFINSQIGRPTLISGHVALTTPVAATLTNQIVVLTAVAKGSAGNSITYALTGGGTAGAEVVTVVGTAISVQIESGVSTVTQVRTAINASGAAAALVTATGTNAATVTAPLAATNLAGGDDGVGAVSNFGQLLSSVTRTGVGQYTFTLADTYSMEQSVVFRVLAATPVDLIPQIKSIDVVTAKTIVVSLLTGATPTEIAANTTLQMNAVLNQSSIYY